MYQTITVPMARVYYNKDNSQEPFCLDFGPGTPSIVCKEIHTTGKWVSMFDAAEDACPKAWMAAEGLIAISIGIDMPIIGADVTS